MTGPDGPDRSFWERSVVGWLAAFYGVLGVVGVLLLLESWASTTGPVR